LASCGFFDCPSLPQGVVNASAGIGDAALSLLFLNGQSIRNALNINGGVDTCSQGYKGANLAGIAIGFASGEGEIQFAERYLANIARDPGLYHNFPALVAQEVLSTEGQVINANYTLYTLEGEINGVKGVYEIGVNAVGEITHYFFNKF
jgi:hypothetical protein